MKQTKYDPDTYLLYGVGNSLYPSYPGRLKVTMNDDVNVEALNQALQRTIGRYPYFAVQVTVDADGIRMADSPLLIGETGYPDISSLSREYSPKAYSAISHAFASDAEGRTDGQGQAHHEPLTSGRKMISASNLV